MQTQRFTRLSGMALAVMLTLLVGSVGADDRKLEGTWDVTLQFTGGSPGCPSSDMRFPTLNTFLKDGGMLFSSGGRLFTGAGQGLWERLGHNHFMARFKFFLFNGDGSLRGYEDLTKDPILLTGLDTFIATTTYHLHLEGPPPVDVYGCTIDETATRFE